jgi:hypothetical protein
MAFNHLIKILNLYENIRYNAEIYRYINTDIYRHVCWFNIDVRMIRRRSFLCKQKLYFRFRLNEVEDMYAYKTHLVVLTPWYDLESYETHFFYEMSLFLFLWNLFNVALSFILKRCPQEMCWCVVNHSTWLYILL